MSKHAINYACVMEITALKSVMAISIEINNITRKENFVQHLVGVRNCLRNPNSFHCTTRSDVIKFQC